jgi:polar amino acid transport system substrate-binding protein
LDAVILDEAVAKNYVKNNKTLEMVNDEALLVEENLIIANKNSKDLIKEVNKAVDEFVKSKKYTELKSKWGC